jgi:hypothetical protein
MQHGMRMDLVNRTVINPDPRVAVRRLNRV